MIVNSDLPIGSLSADDIRQIYLAKRTTFPSGEPVGRWIVMKVAIFISSSDKVKVVYTITVP